MEFSSDKLIKDEQKFLESMTTPECDGCKKGVSMCHKVPCMGTVDDIESMINAGFARNLMLDWWVGSSTAIRSMEASFGKSASIEKGAKNEIKTNPFTEDVNYLVPAIKGYEGNKAPFGKMGTCNLLIDSKCSIHNLNLKPIQGRMACCKVYRETINEEGIVLPLDERISILHTWNSQRGKDLIARWKREVFYDSKKNTEGANVPTTLIEMMEVLFEILGAKNELERQDIGEPIDEKEIKIQTYERKQAA